MAPDAPTSGGSHSADPGSETEQQVTLRDAADLADALPYLMGFYPDDSIVLVGLHGPRGRFGARVRLGIPADPEQWPDVADQLASCLISAADDRGDRPAGMLVFLCQEPAKGERGQDVTQRLRPLAQRLRTACGALDVPVLEALCLSNNRYWSYCCPGYRCCPADGKPMVMPGTSVMAAAAAYAGMQVRGSLKEMEARLTPRTGPRAAEQVKALDSAVGRFLPRMLHANGAHAVRQETLDRAAAMIHRFRQDTPTGSNRARDACDDALLTDAEAAELILGLQDRLTRDRAAEWMEGPSAAAALRVWRALARRCAGAYLEHSVAPLTLAGWVAWSTDDQPSARVALSRALGIDSDYVFAQLLHRGINEGLDPEPLRRCLRSEREEREAQAAVRATSGSRDAAAATRTAPAPGPERTPRSHHAPTSRPTEPRGNSGPPGTRPAARRTRRGGDRIRR
ncbi:DUF4192 domain-containing protein [Streptomyces ramulosus]|uniref:DUF4192 domain-containing protein n=1 Tax=Streptomyces ramulosus TaxID=47762 RepID=A0ABW1FTL6_9ACTN